MVIPGFSNYDISEAGVVTYLPSGKVLKQRKATVQKYYSYIQVTLINDEGKRIACNVMRLMALTYLDKPEKLCMARPKDGDYTNVQLSNVEWVPYTDASKKAWERGKMENRQPRKSSVTEEFIALLYDTMLLFDEPVSMAALSRELDVPYSMVRYSMYALLNRGKAIKLEEGFEAIQ